MKKLSITICVLILLTSFGSLPAVAQDGENNFRGQFDRHFQYASRVLQLAEAMPADLYDWRPMEGVSSVEEVYTHIARYNYYYLENNLGISAPEDVEVDDIESIAGKEAVVDILKRSIQHVQESVGQMPDSKLSEETQLYGQTVNGQAVLMQLVTHMSEHVGQSIAYARMNEIVPPWSR